MWCSLHWNQHNRHEWRPTYLQLHKLCKHLRVSQACLCAFLKYTNVFSDTHIFRCVQFLCKISKRNTRGNVDGGGEEMQYPECAPNYGENERYRRTLGHEMNPFERRKRKVNTNDFSLPRQGKPTGKELGPRSTVSKEHLSLTNCVLLMQGIIIFNEVKRKGHSYSAAVLQWEKFDLPASCRRRRALLCLH